MEIGRLINVGRVSGRLPSEEAKGQVKSRKKASSEDGQEENLAVTTSKSRVEEFSAPINFEYLPSGRILLNREAREQIIDFFE